MQTNDDRMMDAGPGTTEGKKTRGTMWTLPFGILLLIAVVIALVMVSERHDTQKRASKAQVAMAAAVAPVPRAAQPAQPLSISRELWGGWHCGDDPQCSVELPAGVTVRFRSKVPLLVVVDDGAATKRFLVAGGCYYAVGEGDSYGVPATRVQLPNGRVLRVRPEGVYLAKDGPLRVVRVDGLGLSLASKHVISLSTADQAKVRVEYIPNSPAKTAKTAKL